MANLRDTPKFGTFACKQWSKEHPIGSMIEISRGVVKGDKHEIVSRAYSFQGRELVDLKGCKFPMPISMLKKYITAEGE